MKHNVFMPNHYLIQLLVIVYTQFKIFQELRYGVFNDSVNTFMILEVCLIALFHDCLNTTLNFLFNPDIRVVSLDGSIGAGKSTLFNEFKKRNSKSNFNWFTYPRYYFLDEPVGLWSTIKNSDGKGILQMFYEDKKRYSYTFQNMAYITRAQLLLDLIESLKKITYQNFWYKLFFNQYIIVSERSILTDKYVFAQMLYHSQDINQAEMECYNKWHGMLVEKVKLTKMIYVKTSVKVCLDRIKKRSRGGESAINEKYLQDLELYHEKWIQDSGNKMQILILDTTEEFESNTELFNKHLDRIVNFIN